MRRGPGGERGTKGALVRQYEPPTLVLAPRKLRESSKRGQARLRNSCARLRRSSHFRLEFLARLLLTRDVHRRELVTGDAVKATSGSVQANQAISVRSSELLLLLELVHEPQLLVPPLVLTCVGSFEPPARLTLALTFLSTMVGSTYMIAYTLRL